MAIQDKQQLRDLYGAPGGRALKKVLRKLDVHARHFLAKSPFGVISTVDTQGNMDTSPRGGKPGFVYVQDETTILIPDAKGNKLLDSLHNILETGRIASLFLIPGMDETLRINGRASLSEDPTLLARFQEEKNPPKTCIVLKVEEVFLHCAKALMRAQLWDPEVQIERDEMPSMGQMLKDQIGGSEAVESQEDMVRRYQDDL